MARHLLVAFSNATPGKEAEYNEWYAKRHIPDVLDIIGFVSAQRFCISNAQLPGASFDRKYLVIYEIEADDPQHTLDQLSSIIGTPAMPLPDALAPDILALTFSALEPAQRAPSLDT